MEEYILDVNTIEFDQDGRVLVKEEDQKKVAALTERHEDLIKDPFQCHGTSCYPPAQS